MSEYNKPKRPTKKKAKKTPKQERKELFPDIADNAAPNPTPATGAEPKNESQPDPFDPVSLRIDPSTAAGAIGVKRKIVTMNCCKPDKMEFCRVHPDTAFRLETAIIEDKKNRESYLVVRELWPELPDFIQLVRLCLAVNRHGSPFLWPAKLPDPDGKTLAWHTSMLEAQELAVNSWVRCQADMQAGSYAVYEATGNLPDPQWPDLDFRQCLELVFKSRFIRSLDHPFLLELFGQV
ncbi:hypothetical protein Mal15_42670 [Stieleria maiorica]|uniref:Uncharacterized protein n=1 Tax=Stieleria maiorica TaxID=2795974 RepID=A0A5B9MMV2_9BACT|nr:hypothetical protein [Stieleria maiorica]QEG00198.1 hypothetical protein Mal15_42670 [Stieleria maiorica]